MSTPSAPTTPHHHQSFWLWVMCLTGVDYFSTLAYQPSIAFENAGLLAPFASIVLVLVTLFGALPLYLYVAGRSFNGQGSIGMLSNLVSGWPGKILILTLLGFAATDFVLTKTLSAADAAEHLISNPIWPLDHADHDTETQQRLYVTFGLLVLLGAVYMRGFREVIGLAVVIVGVYMLLNAIIIGAGLTYLAGHSEKFTLWLERVEGGQWFLEHKPVEGGGLLTIIVISLLLFPRLALGLSGFETGVSVMPLVQGKPDDDPKKPAGRIRNARKLLFTAATVMSLYLLGSSLVVSTLIDPAHLVPHDAAGEPLPDTGKKPPAADRALAYLAHGEGAEKIAFFCGETFGTIYDLATVVILWFAGASAMAGLLNLVPQYLPRYGMAPEWARAIRPLVLLFTVINLGVTWIFDASVKAQGDAYATGVLALMTSAGVATIIDRWRNRSGVMWIRRIPWVYGLITVVFLYTLLDVVIGKPAGIKIAACFIATILVTSMVSRFMRARELRFSGFQIPDATSRLLWDTIKHLGISMLVPHRPGRRSLEVKEKAIRKEHRIPPETMVVFVQVELADPSEFAPTPELTVVQEEGRYIVRVGNAASIAHTLAAVALEISKAGAGEPPTIHFGWTAESPVSGTLGFLLFGEGNVPWEVRELLIKAQPDETKRPKVMIADA